MYPQGTKGDALWEREREREREVEEEKSNTTLIHMTITRTTTTGHRKSESNDNKVVLSILKIPRIGVSPLDADYFHTQDTLFWGFSSIYKKTISVSHREADIKIFS